MGFLALLLTTTLATGPPPHPQDQDGSVSQTAPDAPGAPDPVIVEPSWTLGEIDITASDIYRAKTAEESLLARLANATHWTTRDSVITREIWFKPGEPVTARMARELERNLRATGLFASVDVELRETGTPGVRDLVVRTRDKLSISGGASAGFVGEIVSGGFSLGESNLFGAGDRIRIGYFKNDEREFRGSLAYRDRYFLGTWTSMNAEVGRTDDGDFASLSFNRPFRYLEDNFAWNVSGGTAETAQDYFSMNERIAIAPFDQDRLNTSAVWRTGNPERFWTRGLTADLIDREYGVPRGIAAPAVPVPGDTTTLYLGGTLSFTQISHFHKVQGLDTIGFVQDVQLGSFARATAGGTYRDEEGTEARVQPTFSAGIDTSVGLGPDRFFRAAVNGDVRMDAGEAVGWFTTADLRAYDLTWRPHTLAAAMHFVEAVETEDLPIQLLLGEGNGLRGYPRREFTGSRAATLILEDRIDLDARVGAFKFGAVAFADIGWIADRSESFGAPLRTVGLGLRIGSESLIGAGVIRIDISFPLDDFEGKSYDPLLSISLGQAFTFR